MDTQQRSIIGSAIAVVLAGLVAWALSDGSATVGSVPVVVVAIGVAFLINWIAFVPAFTAQTERFYDLTGTVTYLATLGVALVLSDPPDLRVTLTAVLVTIWAIRLGTFLFRRVHADGGDGRFDAIKPNLARFLMAWTLQGLWVSLTLAAALALITGTERVDMEWLGWLGVAVWLAGFALEALADYQKRAFRADPAHQGRFIQTGLWAWSRHPNYFGEIVLWVGIALMAVPTLSGWRWVALISPVFVYLLLTRISGIPMLRERGQKRWGSEPEYQAYLDRTPELVPRPPRRTP